MSAEEPRFELRAHGGLAVGGNMGAVTVGADGFYRITPNLWAGVSYTAVPGAWDARGGDNCLYDGDCWYEGHWFLGEAEAHLWPEFTLDPYLGVGLGAIVGEARGVNVSLPAGAMRAGLDVRLGHFVVGPVVTFAGPIGGATVSDPKGSSEVHVPWVVGYAVRVGASF